MNPLIQPKTTTSPLLVTLTLLCFVFFPKVQAVVPPPDGGYPGFNTAEGQNALFSVTTGSVNTAVGWNALFSNTVGSFNTAVGAGALLFNIGDQNTGGGTQNTAIGTAALLNNTGSTNTAVGTGALLNNTAGLVNSAFGSFALKSNITGGDNTAIGVFALYSNTIGVSNTAVGDQALLNNTTGNDNIVLGVGSGSGIVTANNVICIGTDGNNVDNSCYIGNIFNATSSGGSAVFINSNGRLGTATSSRRFKEEINPMDKTSEVLLALKPVTFRYKKDIDPQGIAQFGLVAEEVEKVNPELVVRDKEGKPYSVRYDQVNAMLLNEFLKEHKTVQEQADTISVVKANAARQEATIAHQQKQIETLTAGLQKVSAQLAAASPSHGGLEASKPAPQVVNNP